MNILVPYFMIMMAVAEPGGFNQAVDEPILGVDYMAGVELVDLFHLEFEVSTDGYMVGYDFLNPDVVDFNVNGYVRAKGLSIGYSHDWLDVNGENESMDKIYVKYNLRIE